MAYRRRHGLSRSSTFKEEIRRSPDDDDIVTSSAALHHSGSDPRLDSRGAFHSSFRNKAKPSTDATSTKSTNQSRGFWGVLAKKAKAILDDDIPQRLISPTNANPETVSFSTNNQFTGIQVRRQNESFEITRKKDSQALRMGLERVASKLNQISENAGKALEEHKKTQDISQETRKLQIMRIGTNNEEKNQNPAQPEKNQETKLQASREVAIATAAKVKQLVRELKTVKGELAFAKERCSQLEDENKILREAAEDGDCPADDDMIRLQLETLLAEKGRLAHENSVYARENRYLREIVEFHQLSMQDVVYLDEDIKELNLSNTETPQNPEEDLAPSSSRSQ